MKRWVIIVIVFLLAGAVVNVSVAWGCVSLLPAGGEEWLTTDSATAFLKSHAPEIRIGSQVQGKSWRGLGYRSWSAIDKQYNQVLLQQAGWPTTTLEGHRVGKGLCTVSTHGALWFWHSNKTRWIMLPLRPLWPGFAVNTIFYATTLGLLAYGLLAVRRFVRVRRGQCVKCGYPLGDSAVCSECGKALPTSSRNIIV